MKKIIIVDDEEDYVQLLRKILEKNNFGVDYAFDGEEGLLKIKNNFYDLILLDVNMPKKNGWEVLREVKGDIQTKNIPVIMFTVRCLEEEQLNGFSLGADDYITKPFEPDVLVARVKRMLRDEN